MLLGATMVHDTAGEVSVTGGTPTLAVSFLLPLGAQSFMKTTSSPLVHEPNASFATFPLHSSSTSTSQGF